MNSNFAPLCQRILPGCDAESLLNSVIVVIQISQVFPVTGDVPGVLEISRRLWIPGGRRLRMVALKQNRGSVRSPCPVRL